MPAYGSIGFESFQNQLSADAAGTPAAQAGLHPYALTNSFKFTTRVALSGETVPDEGVKDLEVALPAGLIGNPSATPKCTFEQFTTPHVLSGATCPNDSQIGVAELEIGVAGGKLVLGIYNLLAPPGVPAEFGVNAFSVPIILVPRVRTGSDYGVTTASRNSNQGKLIYGVNATLWGVPASPSHDGERGECLGFLGQRYALGPEHPCPVETAQTPFLRLPTMCQTAGLASGIYADSWQNPAPFNLTLEEAFAQSLPQVAHAETFNHDAENNSLGITGCERLDFSPTVSLHPSSQAAASPTGVSADVSLPQSENPGGLAEADLRRTEVTLPAGLAVSPSSANGRAVCSDTPEPAHDGRAPRPEGEIALHSTEPVECPDASKVGTVEVDTPLLEHPLEGAVYLAQQEANPFGSLLALYVVAEGSGVTLKLAGAVRADENSGQLTVSFAGNPPFDGNPLLEGTPQQPFSHLHMTFFSGPRASLLSPRGCGTYTVSGALTPWSSTLPVAFTQALEFNSACGGGFSPSLVAGTTSNQAGGFSPFSLTLARSDQDQAFGSLTVRTPPGFAAMISKVALCGEPQAAEGTCPDASRIGHVTVAAGPGPEPVVLPQPGRPQDPVYLTGPYNGAPFGLAIVVPPEAGPFNLGRPVVVRSAIEVDPRTAQVTVASGALPTILRGIPLDVKKINVLIDREGFAFNPTSCNPFAVEATVVSDQGAVAHPVSRFQAANCHGLGFHPAFTAATSAHPSKARGASLKVRVVYPKGAQANIAAVKVALPKQLPARLTTLQHACPEEVFAANPASCPVQSDVGTAIARTPVLSTPLSGPAYLVSHGGAAFPDLVFVLQGQGVMVQITGNTDIKRAITTSTFASVPDVPISSFEVSLPQGPHSALAENLPAGSKGNFCKSATLLMPTTLIGHNAARLTQSTTIARTGCARKKRRAPKRPN